jgi:hypothetical protein
MSSGGGRFDAPHSSILTQLYAITIARPCSNQAAAPGMGQESQPAASPTRTARSRCAQATRGRSPAAASQSSWSGTGLGLS